MSDFNRAFYTVQAPGKKGRAHFSDTYKKETGPEKKGAGVPPYAPMTTIPPLLGNISTKFTQTPTEAHRAPQRAYYKSFSEYYKKGTEPEKPDKGNTMKIIIHTSLDLTREDINSILAGRIPDGLAIDKGPDFISIGPADSINILGLYGPGTSWEIFRDDQDKQS